MDGWQPLSSMMGFLSMTRALRIYGNSVKMIVVYESIPKRERNITLGVNNTGNNLSKLGNVRLLLP